MKKWCTLFTDSAREFRSIRTITLCGLFGAMAFLLEPFSIPLGPTKIGFSGLPNEMVDVLFGPAVGSIFSGMMDILKLLVSGGGAWNPGLTLNAFLAGAIYGCFLYKKPISFWRILAAKMIVAMLINVVLGTYWLLPYFENGYWAVLPSRFIKNIISGPVDSVILFTVLKVLEAAGAFRIMNIYIPRKKKQSVSAAKAR